MFPITSPAIPGHRDDPAARPSRIALARARAQAQLPPEYLWYDGSAITPRGVLPRHRERAAIVARSATLNAAARHARAADRAGVVGG